MFWYSHLSSIQFKNDAQLYIPIYIKQGYLNEVNNDFSKKKSKNELVYGEYEIICPVSGIADVGMNSCTFIDPSDTEYSQAGLELDIKNTRKSISTFEPRSESEIETKRAIGIEGSTESKLKKITGKLIEYGFQVDGNEPNKDNNGVFNVILRSSNGDIEIIANGTQFELTSNSDAAAYYISQCVRSL
ncbi:hypothetical protein AYI69_g7169 [Smittium culicis]|uniref:Uncharacterized protein n=1 Tax=Smittium culicis TaxID=133412 RepID=A0A1R1XTY5_9FUNG|nr:hypothetical protein AYI69_g7169 [Smittium culicis]